MIPSASSLRDLPGIVRPLLMMIILTTTVSESCNPSWFRAEREAVSPSPSSLQSSGQLVPVSDSEEEDYEDVEDLYPDQPCGIEETGLCRNGAHCFMHYAPNIGRFEPTCNCTKDFIGERCDEPYNRAIFAAPLLVKGTNSFSIAALSFFSILSLITLGIAVFLYKKLIQREEWESTETESNTPFSNRTNSTLHRRNAFSNSSFYSPPLTSLNPALSNKRLNLDETTIELAIGNSFGSEVSVHPSFG